MLYAPILNSGAGFLMYINFFFICVLPVLSRQLNVVFVTDEGSQFGVAEYETLEKTNQLL